MRAKAVNGCPWMICYESEEEAMSVVGALNGFLEAKKHALPEDGGCTGGVASLDRDKILTPNPSKPISHTLSKPDPSIKSKNNTSNPKSTKGLLKKEVK